MTTSFRRFAKFVAVAVLLSAGTFATVTYASHSWGDYHWARTATPFTLKLGDNVSPSWDAYLSTASTDWSLSSVLDTSVVPGQSNQKNCRGTNGRVEVCNRKYGNNGWLGIASISITDSHITQGKVMLNDTYFNTNAYNTPAWRQFVTCQEIGHTFGLSHQDEDFYNSNLGTCMDYASNPTTNQHPNIHDYEMLETLYAHLDSYTTALGSILTSKPLDVDTSDRSEWGRSIRTSRDGRSSLYERDFGNDQKVFTFVIWAD